MKIMKKLLLASIFLVLFLAAFCFIWLYHTRYSVPILTYHRFDYNKSILSVLPENFEKQMCYIHDKGYKVISFDEFVEGMKKGKSFAHNTVVITIDDGYKNNYTYAYPVLKKYGFPATIFLVTNLIGTDKDHLNWDEVKEMSKNNISFGGHTKNHTYLPSVEKDDILWDEIAGSKEAIEKHISTPVDYFCYPTGGFSERVKAVIKKAGYKGACATNRGYDTLNRIDMYEINRITVKNANPYFSLSNLYAPIRLRAKLSGYYNLFRQSKAGY